MDQSTNIEYAKAEQREKDAVLLWCKLMDYCKENKMNPAEYNSLFAICNAIRNNTGE